MVVTEIQVTGRPQGPCFKVSQNGDKKVFGFFGYYMSYDYHQPPSISKVIHKIVHIPTHFVRRQLAEQPVYLRFLVGSFLLSLIVTEESLKAVGEIRER